MLSAVTAKNLAHRSSGEEWTAGRGMPIGNRRNTKKNNNKDMRVRVREGM